MSARLEEAAVEALARLAGKVPEVLAMLNERSAERVRARLAAASAALPAPGSIHEAVDEVIERHRARVGERETDPGPPEPPTSPFDGSDG